jgi:ubiquinone/menaquinone biosynthesis C-methylase UbiE
MIMSEHVLSQETSRTRARYDRIASRNDWMEALSERRFRPMREKLWSLISGTRVLEVGVGKGMNFCYHPAGAEVTGIDLSGRMLERAQQQAWDLDRSLPLEQMDAQHLAFPDGSFDAAVASFVFCSVPDAVRGLQELARVVRPGGRILLLEHVRIDRPAWIGRLMDLADPLAVRLMGPHINRRTVENVRRAGLEVERVEDLAPRGLVKLIVARAPAL